MAFVKIWVHVVWGTKNREPTLEKSMRPAFFQHIRDNAQKKDIYLDLINGYHDHVHCLISLNSKQCIADITQLLKGEASHWANKEQLFKHKLEWASEYYAVSVSESQVDIVREYIKTQEEHHSNWTFAQECESFMKKFGFAKLADNN